MAEGTGAVLPSSRTESSCWSPTAPHGQSAPSGAAAAAGAQVGGREAQACSGPIDARRIRKRAEAPGGQAILVVNPSTRSFFTSEHRTHPNWRTWEMAHRLCRAHGFELLPCRVGYGPYPALVGQSHMCHVRLPTGLSR